jgi:hypothetical protein
MSQPNDISGLMSNLDQINSQNLKPIFIPSLNREVNFKLLTAAQHKNIITTIMEQKNSGVSLAILLNHIIANNSTERINYNVTDKNYILIALRAYSLSPIYTNNNIKVDLLDILKNKIEVKPEQTQVREDLFTIFVSSPSLEYDSQINRLTKNKIDELANEDTSKASKIALDEVYTNEYIKYINSIEYTQEGVVTKIDFNTLPHTQKRQIIDKMPASTVNSLLSEINKFKELSDKFLTVNDQKIEITFDQSFFTI